MSLSSNHTASPLGEDLEHELQAVATEAGCELIHVEYKGGRLLLVLDHPGGVTLEHCSEFSRQASAALDVNDFGSQNYTLEVSSPGLNRQLYSRRDYERFVDRRVRVRFVDEKTGGRRTIVGRLQSFAQDAGDRIRVIESDTDEPIVVPLERVETARLEIEL